jgi:hypothetical protein
MVYLIGILLFVIFILNYTDKSKDTKFKLEGDQFNTRLGYSYLDSCYSKFYNNYENMNYFQ